MSAVPVQMGPNAVKNPAALIASLKPQQPAQNPGTPVERINPEIDALEKIKASAYSISQAKDYTNDPHLRQVFDIIEGTLNKALLKFDGVTVLQSLVESVQLAQGLQAGVPAPGSVPGAMGVSNPGPTPPTGINLNGPQPGSGVGPSLQ